MPKQPKPDQRSPGRPKLVKADAKGPDDPVEFEDESLRQIVRVSKQKTKLCRNGSEAR